MEKPTSRGSSVDPGERGARRPAWWTDKHNAAWDHVKEALREEAGLRDWEQVESAVRFGYGARKEFAEVLGWDAALEGRLRHEWTHLKDGNTWEDVRPHVRHGWDAAERNSIV